MTYPHVCHLKLFVAGGVEPTDVFVRKVLQLAIFSTLNPLFVHLIPLFETPLYPETCFIETELLADKKRRPISILSLFRVIFFTFLKKFICFVLDYRSQGNAAPEGSEHIPHGHIDPFQGIRETRKAVSMRIGMRREEPEEATYYILAMLLRRNWLKPTFWHEIFLSEDILHAGVQRQLRRVQWRAMSSKLAIASNSMQIVRQCDSMTRLNFEHFVFAVAVERSPFE